MWLQTARRHWCCLDNCVCRYGYYRQKNRVASNNDATETLGTHCRVKVLRATEASVLLVFPSDFVHELGSTSDDFKNVNDKITIDN